MDEENHLMNHETEAHPCRFIYIVDDQNCIRSLSGAWDSFAYCNHASPHRCSASSIMGKPLLDFVQGKETKHLYELIIEKVRSTGETIIIPFRCDSPEEKRFLELRIAPLREGWLEFTSTILRREPREPLILLKNDVRRSENFIKLCSMCKKAATPEGHWLEIEHAISRLELFSANALPQITHGLCPDCSPSFILDFQV